MKTLKLITVLFFFIGKSLLSQINFNMGLKYYNEANYKEAIYWLDKSVNAGSEEQDKSLTLRGLAKSKSGDYKGADEDLFAALKLKPGNVDSYYNISLSFVDQKKYELALHYIDSAMLLSKEPKDYLYNQQSLTYSLINDNKKAVEIQLKALELNPNDHDNNLNMGWYYYSLKDYPNALKYCTKAINLVSYSYKGLSNRMMCYIDMEQYDSAIVDIDNVLKNQPLSPFYIAKKGEIRYKQKKYNQACKNFDDLKNLNDSLWKFYIKKYCDNKDIVNYYPNGKMEEKCTYKNGYKNGNYFLWYENGKLQTECFYVDGKYNGIYKSYYENGKIDKTGNVIDDKQDGEWTHYYESGKVKIKGNMLLGLDNGITVSYYENGNIQLKVPVNLGKREGLGIENYENGIRKAEYNFKYDVEQGEYRLYHPNGKLKQKGTLLNGKEFDSPEEWDAKGNPIKH